MLKAFHKFFIKDKSILKSSDFHNDFLAISDSIYEVIRIIDLKSMFFDEHYLRLKKTAATINFPLWLSKTDLLKEINHLLLINEITSGNIEIIFSYHKKSKQKHFYCLFIEDRYPNSNDYKKGVKSELFYGKRDQPNAKKINLDFRNITSLNISEKNIYEVILVGENGSITEGSRSNIFFIKNNKIYTSKVKDVLAGITREKVIFLCQQLGVSITELEINKSELSFFDAAFFTGTSPKVLPITQIGSIKYNPLNPLLQTLIREYDLLISNSLKPLIF